MVKCEMIWTVFTGHERPAPNRLRNRRKLFFSFDLSGCWLAKLVAGLGLTDTEQLSPAHLHQLILIP